MKKFSNDTTEYVEKLEDEKKALLEALVGLYQHTKNDMVICGLNQKAKEAIAKAEGKP